MTAKSTYSNCGKRLLIAVCGSLLVAWPMHGALGYRTSGDFDLIAAQQRQAMESRMKQHALPPPYETLFEYRYKIEDVTSEGCRVIPDTDRDRRSDRDEDIFIDGLKGLSGRTYHGPLTLLPDGEYKYKTISSGSRTIPRYKLIPKDEVERLRQKLAADRKEALDAANAARAQQAKAEAEKKRLKMEAKTIELLERRIADGSADAAWDLGNRYLDGQGVLADAFKARSLIALASERGNERAKQWLLKTPPPQPLTPGSK